MSETRRWRLVITYGVDEELGAVTLPPCSEEVADEAARALLRVMNRIAREQEWPYGCGVRMDQVALGRHVKE